ncbi:MAG TPA: hypothetical protein VIJ23_14180, partial [Mycobacterium sp.]
MPARGVTGAKVSAKPCLPVLGSGGLAGTSAGAGSAQRRGVHYPQVRAVAARDERLGVRDHQSHQSHR